VAQCWFLSAVDDLDSSDMTGGWAWWHDLAEIVGAVGSAGAAGVAVWLATRERADRKTAERDRDEARSAQRSAELAERRRNVESQARRVVIWVSVGASVNDGGTVTSRSMLCEVANHSDLPILKLHLGVAFADGLVTWADFRQSLAPSGKFTIRFPEVAADYVLPVEGDVFIEFSDAYGRRWRRHADARLEPSPPIDRSRTVTPWPAT
jgi:hypothetical protein